MHCLNARVRARAHTHTHTLQSAQTRIGALVFEASAVSTVDRYPLHAHFQVVALSRLTQGVYEYEYPAIYVRPL
jgi:hypothetical protein